MLYRTYQAQSDLHATLRLAAAGARAALSWLPPPLAGLAPVRALDAGWRIAADTAIRHERPDWGIRQVETPQGRVAIVEQVDCQRPFVTLRRFVRVGAAPAPKVLLVAPMAGHFATLLRETAQTLLSDHEVWVTDWHNARDVPLSEGRFDLDDYIAELIGFARIIGPGLHIVAVCQPCVAALAATALLAEDGDPATPRSLSLMAGPVDTRIAPTEVNAIAHRYPLWMFEQRVVQTVPYGHAGSGRKVYPGFLQIAGFMNMNAGRHRESLMRRFTLLRGLDPQDEAESIRAFYDEYLAVCDLPAEFYLDTMRRVFIEWHLARGCLQWRGRRVDCGAITSTRLLTVEGAKDDICGLGQTAAAHALCSRLDPALQEAYVQDGAGHYGVFSGRRWQQEIYPKLAASIAAAE
ncbi:polyhydroxyalkanoate depolymerase [Nevskia sp.]|uniref:polyhydroxyalkanoate depolymerase n=1 Tax=Nevskia sp. TaxID=1929292 RepID=UPI003F6F3D72